MLKRSFVDRLRHRSQRLQADDAGITVVELMIVSLIISIAMATVGALMAGLLRDWHIQEALANVQEDSRPVVREMLIQIRQSQQPLNTVASHPVAEVAWDKLVFYSDRLGDIDTAPEEHVYELINCSNGVNGGICELQLTITSPDDPTLPSDWTYTGSPDRVEVVLDKVLAQPPTEANGDPLVWVESEVENSLFHLVRWDGSSGTSTREIIGACDDGGSVPCDGNLVVISLRIDPSTVKESPAIFELYEEVRLRNA